MPFIYDYCASYKYLPKLSVIDCVSIELYMQYVHDVGEAMDIVMRDSIDHLSLQRFSRSGEVRKEAAKDRKATRSRPVVSTTLY